MPTRPLEEIKQEINNKLVKEMNEFLKILFKEKKGKTNEIKRKRN